jgi:WD40 repeat protein
VFALAFSPDGTLLASNSADDGVYLWDVETGTLLQTIDGHFDSVTSQPFSHDSSLLALEWKHTVRIWNVETGRIVQALDHASDVQGITFSPDGTTLATGAWSDTVQSWDIETGVLLGALEGYHRSVSASAISPGDTIFLSHFWEDGEIVAWDVRTGQIVRTLEGHTSGVTNLALSADGTMLASSEIWDLSVWIWDVETGRRLRTLGHHATFVRSIALSPDGGMMASGSDAKYAGMYDVQTGELLHSLGQEDPVHHLTFSPDGSKLATGTWNTLRLWDTETGESLRTLELPEGYGRGGIVFSPDGDMVAAGANDGTVWLLDVDTGRSVRSFRGHTGGVSSVAFSPGGALLASAAGDRTVRLWDVETGRLVHMLDTGSVGTLTFSQDGLILAGAGSGILRLWGIPPTD